MRAPPQSVVILSDEEAAQKVRDENNGQPDEWVDEIVAKELAERADLQRWAQQAYDTAPPSNRG